MKARAALTQMTEANPDGTISPDEPARTADMLGQFQSDIDAAIQKAVAAAEEIGGQFRSPRIKHQIKTKLLAAADTLSRPALTRGRVADFTGAALQQPASGRELRAALWKRKHGGPPR